MECEDAARRQARAVDQKRKKGEKTVLPADVLARVLAGLRVDPRRGVVQRHAIGGIGAGAVELGGKTPDRLALKQALGVSIGEALDHRA